MLTRLGDLRRGSGLATTALGAWLAGWLVAAGGLSVAQTPGLESLRDRGQAAFEEKQYGDAQQAFAAVAAHAAATAQDLFNLALARYELNDDSGAAAALDDAQVRDTDLAAIHYLRGLIHRRASEPAAARRALERAEQLAPNDPAVLYSLGVTLESLEEPEAGRERFQRVIDMGFEVGFQHYVSSLYRSGFQLMRAGERDAAGPYLERYQEYHRRLSQAQRAPAASEAGPLKQVVVPVANLAAADPESASRVAFMPPESLATRGRWAIVGDLGAGPTVLVPRADGVLLHGGDSYALEAAAGPAALGDFDRDGYDDLLVAADDGLHLYRNEAAAAPSLAEVTAGGLPDVGGVTSVQWVDADHDGDLDILLTSGVAGASVRLIDNHGGNTFADATAAARLDGSFPAASAVWADFDDDSDVDLYVVHPGADNTLYTNARGGRFEEIGAAVGAAGGRGDRVALAEDLDNDGAVDLVLGGDSGVRLLRNTGGGTFEAARMTPALGAVTALAATDLNNDGFLDLVADTGAGVLFLINEGDLSFGLDDRGLPGRFVAARDENGDGAADLLLENADSLAWYRQAGPVAPWLALRLAGIKNNIRGIGARLEIKAQGSYQRRTMRHGSIRVGLGHATTVEVVRITWPNGIVQNEIDVAPDQAIGPVVEIERLEGSCPLLYTWDGTGWRFINEVLGVAPLGMPLAVGVIHPADSDEYVLVPGEALQPLDGAFELRFTEELREAGYLDAIRLLAVDHPPNTQVVPDERFVSPPHPEFRIFLVDEPLVPVARNERGDDVTELIRSVDGRWTSPAALGPYEGLAAPHAVELELPAVGGDEVLRLFLTGWVYWATGSANLVVAEDPRFGFEPVRLEVPDGAGGWRVAIDDIGLPNAKNSTLAVELTGIVDPNDPRVRVSTNMRLYWDSVFYTLGGPHPRGLVPAGDWAGEWGVPKVGSMRLVGGESGQVPRVHILAPAAAEIRFRGFSRLNRGRDGFETFSYGIVSSTAPWNQHPGTYTRYGPVGELLQAADDRYAIVGTGDEVAVRFADTLPPPPEGWRRDWLVYLNGWVKDGDPNTLHGDRVEPLPYHAMSSYPYRLDETYPTDRAHREYELRYNTRPARANQPLLGPRRPWPARGSVPSARR